MSSASELFSNRRSRASRRTEGGLRHEAIASDRDRHSLRRSFLRRRRSHFAGHEDVDPTRQTRALLRSEHEASQSFERRLDESGGRNSINNGSIASDRIIRLSSTSNAQLPTTVLQARARLLERLRGISVAQNRQEEVASSLTWNDSWDEETGRNSHDSGRTRGISLSGSRRDMVSPSTNILEELATINDYVDRIRSQISRDLSQFCIFRYPGLSHEAIDSLLHEVFKPELGGNAETRCDCSVCLESFKEGDGLLRLHCGHRFHRACLEPWLRICADCPNCRAKIQV